MINKLIEQAVKATERSYSPYSSFKVGAALLTKNGKIFTGCNIENASFSPTVCAERVAFFKALSEGEREFTAIAIVGGKNEVGKEPCAPCGVCRQVMTEFCNPNEFKIILPHQNGNDEYLLKELMPLSFNGEKL